MKTLASIEPYLRAEIDPAYRARAEFILEHALEAQPERVLDAGCGRGFYLKMLSILNIGSELVGLDADPRYLEMARSVNSNDKRVRVEQGSITALPFEADYFDFIICSEVLEHLADDSLGLSEVKRVLKPGGSLALSVPSKNFPFLWDPLNWLLMRFFSTHVPKHIHWLAGIWADHERLYNFDEFEALVAAQCEITRKQSVVSACWPFSHFILYGLGKNLVEKCGFKNFDRFQFQKPKPYAQFIAWLFALPDKIFGHEADRDQAVNLLLIAKK